MKVLNHIVIYLWLQSINEIIIRLFYQKFKLASIENLQKFISINSQNIFRPNFAKPLISYQPFVSKGLLSLL